MAPRLRFIIGLLLCSGRGATYRLLKSELVEIFSRQPFQVVQLILLLYSFNLARALGSGCPSFDIAAEAMLPSETVSRALMDPLRPLQECRMLCRPFLLFSILDGCLSKRSCPPIVLQQSPREEFAPRRELSKSL